MEAMLFGDHGVGQEITKSEKFINAHSFTWEVNNMCNKHVRLMCNARRT